jgi:integration host factor subunit alpha
VTRSKSGQTLTREMLSNAVKRVVGLSTTQSRTLIDQVLEEIAGTLERSETVKLSSFGSFVVQRKKERFGRNPKTGEPATISARRIVRFKPSPVLKKQISSLPERYVELDHG